HRNAHVVRALNTRAMAAQTMGEVRVPVTFRGPKGAATVEDVLVDTGATHTAVVSGLAAALGLVARWRHPFETANGRRDCDIALAALIEPSARGQTFCVESRFGTRWRARDRSSGSRRKRLPPGSAISLPGGCASACSSLSGGGLRFSSESTRTSRSGRDCRAL